MKPFQQYLSSIKKGGIVEVLEKRMATIMNLTPCRVCSEVYRGSFPKAGLLSLSFHHSKAIGDTRAVQRSTSTNSLALTSDLNMIIFKICLGAGSRQYCRYTKSPLGITPLKEIWESPRVKENLTSVGFEPTTSGLDLPMFYRLSYEASTGAGRGNLGSELRLIFK